MITCGKDPYVDKDGFHPIFCLCDMCQDESYHPPVSFEVAEPAHGPHDLSVIRRHYKKRKYNGYKRIKI